MKTISSSVYSESLFGSSGMPLFILDNLRSAYNVGSVFRTAEAIHPCGIFLTGICCRPGNRKLAHTSRGTYAAVPWRFFREAEKALEWALESGRTVVAVENVPGALPLWEADFSLSSAFILGNEALGVKEELMGMAHKKVFFPQSGSRHCLNVSSTAALIAAEIQRRRRARNGF
ncbi:MAG: TrmH family RNA methyltransferase [Candidatus Aegiribacteria sp.]|nr:TrmH family RNA methyltransferase [Candidatus Aegiribacteria sp.]MBD3295128.1 TrmH family RNA methyltransferase [Candidatus Fermentibacteria bacterium]